MKLLLDENLSRRIVPLLQADYPGSSQVALLQLEAATDHAIWEYAKSNDFVIVTRDSDFHELGTLYGAPAQNWQPVENYHITHPARSQSRNSCRAAASGQELY